MVRLETEKMDNTEDVLDALNGLEKKESKMTEIPAVLEQFICRIAKTGETIFPWPKLKTLFACKLENVMNDFTQEFSMDTPTMDRIKVEETKQRIINNIQQFQGAPFTIQRICELIIEPKKHYKRTDKFLRGVEKNVMVVSTVDPLGKKILSAVNSKQTLFNGVDVNGFDDGSGDKAESHMTTFPSANPDSSSANVPSQSESSEDKPTVTATSPVLKSTDTDSPIKSSEESHANVERLSPTNEETNKAEEKEADSTENSHSSSVPVERSPPSEEVSSEQCGTKENLRGEEESEPSETAEKVEAAKEEGPSHDAICSSDSDTLAQTSGGSGGNDASNNDSVFEPVRSSQTLSSSADKSSDLSSSVEDTDSSASSASSHSCPEVTPQVPQGDIVPKDSACDTQQSEASPMTRLDGEQSADSSEGVPSASSSQDATLDQMRSEDEKNTSLALESSPSPTPAVNSTTDTAQMDVDETAAVEDSNMQEEGETDCSAQEESTSEDVAVDVDTDQSLDVDGTPMDQD